MASSTREAARRSLHLHLLHAPLRHTCTPRPPILPPTSTPVLHISTSPHLGRYNKHTATSTHSPTKLPPSAPSAPTTNKFAPSSPTSILHKAEYRRMAEHLARQQGSFIRRVEVGEEGEALVNFSDGATASFLKEDGQVDESFEEVELGPLDRACLTILSDTSLAVNLDILALNAVSLTCPTSSAAAHRPIRRAKERGMVRTGGLTVEHDEVIMDNFETLVREAGVDRALLEQELFAKRRDKEFLARRVLLGCQLLRGLPDAERRLPVEAVNRLATLLSSGAFTAEEDSKILAWVAARGVGGWSELARSLGRRSAGAPSAVMQRHCLLQERKRGRRKGGWSVGDLVEVVGMVLEQVPEALEQEVVGSVEWGEVASAVNRTKAGVYELWVDQVMPGYRRCRCRCRRCRGCRCRCSFIIG